MTKYLIIGSISLSILLVGSAFLISSNQDNPSSSGINNVSIEEGNQVITITARGGYSPRISEAKANTPTEIKIITKGTFDCSSSLVIPSLGYEKNLPMTGETVIDVPPQKPGTILQGYCAMGMYSFQIEFK